MAACRDTNILAKGNLKIPMLKVEKEKQKYKCERERERTHRI